MIEFDVAAVARPVISVARLVDKGFEVHFGAQGSCISKGGHWVDIHREGKLYVLRVKVASSACQHVGTMAPVTEAMPKVAREPPQAPDAAQVAAHALAHLPYARWSEVCMRAKARDSPHQRQGVQQPGHPQIGGGLAVCRCSG